MRRIIETALYTTGAAYCIAALIRLCLDLGVLS